MARALGHGAVRLLVLSLISERARHGYEIIKAVEELSGGRYSPSPGVVYPTLSYLEDAGYVLGDAQGSKKHYSITDEGKAHLASEKERVDAIFARLKAHGNESFDTGVELRPTFRRLWFAVMSRARKNAELDSKIVEILEKAAEDISRL